MKGRMRMNRNMIEHLREQYPPGTRIRLGEMRDPFSPVPPGTLGSVSMVDDAGTIHMKWDNGRGLGLIPGEDSFSVVVPALTHSKLYMPLHGDLYTRNEYGDLEEYPEHIDRREAMHYSKSIFAAIERYREPEEAERSLMLYYREQDSVNEKVHSAEFDIEERADSLWGIVKLSLKGELDAPETATLLDYLTGQASDGWGEGFEQQDIQVDDGNFLNIHLWSSEHDWQMMTEAEFAQKYEQTQAPQMDGLSY
ncbi:DUF4314 domain-containing protein [Oscillospiraceae bacterium OttesenSCG-928-G22]|nr:DUF4314 domain-containing protein [Oscillospiraceae bacterium OttesenSCG-928-G22]